MPKVKAVAKPIRRIAYALLAFAIALVLLAASPADAHYPYAIIVLAAPFLAAFIAPAAPLEARVALPLPLSARSPPSL